MDTPSLRRLVLLAAGLLGLTGVALGALGAHRLEPILTERGMTHAWETGSRYHLLHAVSILALAALLGRNPAADRRLGWAAACWSVGTALFSGSLYWFALGGPHPLVFVTPLGGVSLLAGWLCVMASALATPAETPGR